MPTFPVLLATAVNRGISERWGEQPTPIMASAPGTYQVADALVAAGVEPQFAADAIYRAVLVSTLERPPRSVRYFEALVLEQWGAHLAGPTATAAGAFTPTPRLSEAERVQRLLDLDAIAYARQGNVEYVAICEDRGLTWRADA